MQSGSIITQNCDGIDFIHIQRKQVVLIFKKNNGFYGRLISGLLMFGGIHACLVETFLRIQDIGLYHYTQYIGHLFIYNTFRNSTAFYSLNQRICKIPLIVIVHHGTHLQVEAG